MLQTALNILGLPARNCLMVGDRLYTDIAMAVDAGLDSALVLTGTARDDGREFAARAASHVGTKSDRRAPPGRVGERG